MANKRVKLVTVDDDGDKDQVFPETDMYSVINLLAIITEIQDDVSDMKSDIKKLKNKTGVK